MNGAIGRTCLVLLLVVGICAGLAPAIAEQGVSQSSAEVSRKPVTTEMISEIAFHPVRNSPATAVSLNDTRVSAEIRGVVKSINVQVGERVGKSEVIARLDCKDYEIVLAEAQAAYRSGQAQRKFERSQLNKAKKLSEKRSISSEELDRRVSNTTASAAEVERLEALVDKARRSIDKCDISAPFNAVVIERLASAGDYVVEGAPIVRLLDESNVEVMARVQEQDLETLKATDDLVFAASQQYPIRLRAILPLMESRTRSYEVRLEFVGERAPPGSAGRIIWRLPQFHVPADLIVRRERLGIFLVDDGVANFLPLEHARVGQPAAVDVPSSAKVVVDGRFGLEPGDAVEIIEP